MRGRMINFRGRMSKDKIPFSFISDYLTIGT